jgi:uracil-DNA glycosylase family 4
VTLLKTQSDTIIKCNRCPELRKYCHEIAVKKRRSFSNETYWGKPVPSFGLLNAKLVVVGLAPAAHGANRTGRMFTGDRSGEWLYRTLFKFGFANQPLSLSRGDGLDLNQTLVTAVLRCAPPGNKPTIAQLKRCRTYLNFEILKTEQAQVFVCLGKVAYEQVWESLKLYAQKKGWNLPKKRPKFEHDKTVSLTTNARHSQKPPLLILSYHPSQQNTFTKRLTKPMFDSIFKRARMHIDKPELGFS